jgi:hypothetical protein
LILGVRWLISDAGSRRIGYGDADFIPPKIDFPGYTNFANLLREAATDGNTVILVMVDTEYVSLAINFYVSSILKHGINNCVFVAVDKAACKILGSAFQALKHRCFVFDDDDIEDKKLYGHHLVKHFKDKRYLKRFLIVETLKLRHNVLVVDPDTVFLENPLSDVKKTCGHSDIAAMWDGNLDTHDAGFVYSRSTERTIAFYELLASYEISHGSGQFALNAAIKEAKQKKTIKIEQLSPKKYKVGSSFFENNMCPDRKSYKGVMVVHNNYIREAHNKILRFKECMLWDWDGFDRYYTDPGRKYITVETLGSRGYPEHQTLLNAFAIASTLRRTVILPRVQCKKAKCNMLNRIYDEQHLHFVKHLDYATVGNYRESTFLLNPRVPSAVKHSISPMFHIPTQTNNRTDPSTHREHIHILVSRDSIKGPTVHEIHDWLASRQERVIRFDALTGWFRNLDYPKIISEELVKVIRQL